MGAWGERKQNKTEGGFVLSLGKQKKKRKKNIRT